MINELFGAAPFEFMDRWSNPSLILNLAIFATCKFVFTVIAVGCPISCGVFTPVFLIVRPQDAGAPVCLCPGLPHAPWRAGP